MRVKQLVKGYYNRRDILPGEEYEMDDREETQAKLLQAVGTIQILEEPKQAAPAMVKPAVQSLEQPVTAVAEPMTTQTPLTAPRRYRRRDMKAEE